MIDRYRNIQATYSRNQVKIRSVTFDKSNRSFVTSSSPFPSDMSDISCVVDYIRLAIVGWFGSAGQMTHVQRRETVVTCVLFSTTSIRALVRGHILDDDIGTQRQ